jgi:hypothetical protein
MGTKKEDGRMEMKREIETKKEYQNDKIEMKRENQSEKK